MAKLVNIPPAPGAVDAANRAWRTLAQGLLVDVLTTTAVAVAAAVTDIEWTRAYWLGVAALAGKTVIMSGLSYLARRALPPPTV